MMVGRRPGGVLALWWAAAALAAAQGTQPSSGPDAPGALDVLSRQIQRQQLQRVLDAGDQRVPDPGKLVGAPASPRLANSPSNPPRSGAGANGNSNRGIGLLSRAPGAPTKPAATSRKPATKAIKPAGAAPATTSGSPSATSRPQSAARAAPGGIAPVPGSGPTHAPPISALPTGPRSATGIELVSQANGEVAVGAVAPESAAAQAGLKAGDTILGVNGKRTRGMTSEQVGALLSAAQGTSADLTIGRGDQILDLNVTVENAGGRGQLGLQVATKDGEYVVAGVRPGSPAEAAGLKVGDVLLSVGGRRAETIALEDLVPALQSKEASEAGLRVARGDQILTLKFPANQKPDTPSPQRPNDLTASRPNDPTTQRPTPIANLKGFTQKEWAFRPEGQGRASLDGSHLLLSVQPNESGGIEGWSRGVLRGDFVVDFHQRVEDWAHEQGDTLFVEFRFNAAPKPEAPGFVVRRRVDATGVETFEVIAPGQQRAVVARGKHISMSLQRRGREWALAQFDSGGAGWIPLARLALDLPEDVYLGVAARKTGASLLQMSLMLGDGGGVLLDGGDVPPVRAVPPGQNEGPRRIDLTGAWRSGGDAAAEVKHVGNSVEINYRGGKGVEGLVGRLEGSFDGTTLLATYKLTRADGAAGNGRVVLKLQPDGSLEGHSWVASNNTPKPDFEFSLTRVKPNCE